MGNVVIEMVAMQYVGTVVMKSAEIETVVMQYVGTVVMKSAEIETVVMESVVIRRLLSWRTIIAGNGLIL